MGNLAEVEIKHTQGENVPLSKVEQVKSAAVVRVTSAFKRKSWALMNLGLSTRALREAVDRLPLLRAQASSVVKVNLSMNPIASWPWDGPVPLLPLPACQELILDSTSLTVLPSAIDERALPSLKVLSLAMTPLVSLKGSWLDPSSPVRSPPPHRLKRLTISRPLPAEGNDGAMPPLPPPDPVSFVSEFFIDHNRELFSGLESLHLARVHLGTIPKGILDLAPPLKSLTLNSCGLEAIPQALLDGLPHLEVLSLQHTPELQSLPGNWTGVVNLRRVFLEGCTGLRWIPMGLLSCPVLDTVTYRGVQFKVREDFDPESVHRGRMLLAVPRFVDHRQIGDEELAALLKELSWLSPKPLAPPMPGSTPSAPKPPLPPPSSSALSWVTSRTRRAAGTSRPSNNEDELGDELVVTGPPSKVLSVAQSWTRTAPSLKTLSATVVVNSLRRKAQTLESLGAIPEALLPLLEDIHQCECRRCRGKTAFLGRPAEGVVFLKQDTGEGAYDVNLGAVTGLGYQKAEIPLSVVLNPAHCLSFLRLQG